MAVARPCNVHFYDSCLTAKYQGEKKLTFAASAFAKASFGTALTVQALAKILVGPEHALLLIAALAVGGQDGLVQSCLGHCSSLRLID